VDYEYRFFTHSISAHGVVRLDKVDPIAEGWEPLSMTSTYAARAEDVVVVVLARREKREPARKGLTVQGGTEAPERSGFTVPGGANPAERSGFTVPGATDVP